MRALFNSNYPILIQGETGTGKTKLAKKIHKTSSYKYSRYVECNLAGIADNLFESELFGHTKGSFTGACSDKIGFCEKAGSGTLFFDEIGDITLSQQKKLLQVLDTGEFFRVGSTEKSNFSGRFIFATHKDLEKLVRQGAFREDLFYRLGGVSFSLDPLREKTDAQKSEAINEFIIKAREKYGLSNKYFHSDVMKALSLYSWPGNYREMKTTIELVMLKSTRPQIELKDLPYRFHCSSRENSSFKRQISDLERKILYNEVVNKGVGINKASKSLGISKTTLIAKLRKYGISEQVIDRVNLKVA